MIIGEYGSHLIDLVVQVNNKASRLGTVLRIAKLTKYSLTNITSSICCMDGGM